MPPLPNISSYQSEIQPARPSDSRNWRSPAQTTYNTYSQSNLSYSTPTATDVQYQQQRSQFTVGQSWESFQNPLNQAEEDEERPEAIVERLKQKAADAKAVKEELQRKPNIISKAGLALIEKDLLDAAKPFETVESLQQCREKQLGLLSNEPTSYGGDAQKKEETEFVNLPPLVSALSAEAKEFIPSPSISPDTERAYLKPKENEEAALKLVNDCVYELACNPASFDEAVPKDLVPKLNALNLNQSSIEKIVDLIYEACVLEQNFRYLGGQLCDILSRSTGGLPGFRTTLLKKAQKEFESMAKALDGTKEELTRALGFTQYTAELFLSLTMAEQDGTMVRFSVLGRAILGVVEKLIKHPDNDDCIQCAVRVLKLTIISLEDALQNDGKDSTTKLANILDQLTSLSNDASSKLNNLSKNLLKGLLKLREQNWGRAPADEPHKPQAPGQDPNYILNEPVFFTPQGVEYTTADAADPEFYQQHL
uniref:Polyadenylate-binding protein-interacting protein 1 n=1 Tax=Ciona intestinalis TaxID=7719 RepID=F6TIK7_CIOIN